MPITISETCCDPNVVLRKSRIKRIRIKTKMGEKSSPPMGGSTLRTGAMTGSVYCQTSISRGCGFTLPENIITKDMMMDAIMAYQ